MADQKFKSKVKAEAGIQLSAETTARALIVDGSGDIKSSSVTSTELGYVSGLTSDVQTQINDKANKTLSNLTSPTAINQDLIFDKSSPVLQSKNQTSTTPSQLLSIKTGTTQNADSGNLEIATGTSNDTDNSSGRIDVFTGDNLASDSSVDTGNINISTGFNNGATATGNSGGINISTGPTTDGNSGQITLTTGSPSGVGSRGQISLNGSAVTLNGVKIISLADPTSAQDAATKAYVDAVAEGLRPKEAVRAATTANITIATALNSGDSIDGVTLANGDRVLVKDQAAPEENGIYIVGATPARSTDFDSLSPIDEINGAMVAVQEGTANAGKLFVQAGTVATIDTDPITFVFFNSVSSLVGGDGITVSGSNVSVDHDGEGLQFSSNQLALELDGSTLSKSATGIKVASGGITNTEINASAAIDATKIADGSVTNTEFQYIGGLTSDAQTQLGNKASTILDNLGTTAINASLIPATDLAIDLGSPTPDKRFRYGYVGEMRDASDNIVLDVTNRTLRSSSTVMLAFSSTDIDVRTNIVPNAPHSLGSSTNNFATIYNELYRNGSSSPAMRITSTIGLLRDSSNATSVDFQNRTLSSGATNKLDWSATEITLGANLSPDADANNRALGNVTDNFNIIHVKNVGSNAGLALQAGGGDLQLDASTDVIQILSNSTTIAPQVQFYDETNTNYVAVQSPLSLAGSYTLTLPTTDGNASEVLQTNGSGVLSWAAVPSASAGDIAETSFAAANNVAAAANVTGLAFANATVRSFKAMVSVTIDATADLYEVFELQGIQKGASWDMSVSSVGDNSQIVFSITNAGQVQYTSANLAGFTSNTMKFRAQTTTV